MLLFLKECWEKLLQEPGKLVDLAVESSKKEKDFPKKNAWITAKVGIEQIV